MKGLKFYALGLAAALMLNSCSWSNTAKGGTIGGASGAALGAALGALIAKDGSKGKWAGIAGGIGAVAGTAVGLAIGKKMDNAKKQAEAIANAKVEDAVDQNGYQAVKVTFESGILFPTGSSTLGAAAQSSLNQFAQNVLKANADMNVGIVAARTGCQQLPTESWCRSHTDQGSCRSRRRQPRSRQQHSSRQATEPPRGSLSLCKPGDDRCR